MKHHRRSLRLKDYDYSQAGAYFITICTHKKESIFGEIRNREMILNRFGEITKNEWLKAAILRRNVELDEFVVMPNHFHGIIIIEESNDVGATRRVAPTKESVTCTHTLKPNTIGSIIGQFKSVVTKEIRKKRFTHFRWQRNYYEHIIRNENDLNEVREYIVNNPLKWELDKDNPEYIYSG
jgi:REP element-mobilizing transposase RayT